MSDLVQLDGPVLVLGALDSEVNLLEATLALQSFRSTDLSTFHFTEGAYCGIPVVAGCTEMGSVNAAAACALAISHFSPCCVISQGTAGAHDPGLHIGDIVLGKQIRNIHFISTAHADVGQGVDLARWRYIGPDGVLDDTGENPSQHGVSPASSVPDIGADALPGADASALLTSSPHLIELAQHLPNSSGGVFVGTLASGDVWNRELDRITFFHQGFGTLCEDMETFAIAQVCTKLNVPVLALRVISNSEHHLNRQFDPTTAEIAQHFTLRFIEALSNKENLMPTSVGKEY